VQPRPARGVDIQRPPPPCAHGSAHAKLRNTRAARFPHVLARAVTASNVLSDRPQHARAGPIRLAPRLAPRGGHWGLGGLRPVREGYPSAQPLPQRTPRSPRAARTARGTGWRAPTADSPFQTSSSPCPHAVGGSARTARRSAGQGCGGGGPTGGPTRRAFCKHSGGRTGGCGPLLYAARLPVVAVLLLQLGQRLNAADVAWAGQRLHVVDVVVALGGCGTKA
jgi:hypothetical protein